MKRRERETALYRMREQKQENKQERDATPLSGPSRGKPILNPIVETLEYVRRLGFEMNRYIYLVAIENRI